MRKFLILFFISISIFAQIKDFNTDVETNKKPWSHLNFYNNPDNFQFAIVSDNTGGSRKGIFEKAVSKINLLMPEFVMCVGDLIAGYTQDTAEIRKEWNEFNGWIDDLKPPFFYLPGNHDITNKVMEKEWEKRYGRRYYQFIYKNTLFIIMDSNDDDDFSITIDQRDFVIKTLKENPNVRWTFLFMHHPIWNYDTNNRFEEIENELAKRKYTVFAGHEHHYKHKVRNDHNYYVLGTTGAGSALRGHRFGEFDHITWLTLTDEGPVFANLEMDGIHDHDVSNEETDVMAKSLLKNTKFENILLTNEGAKFSDGTLYLYFNNSTDFNLNVNLQFYHHHELYIDKPIFDFDLSANSDSIIAIDLDTENYLDYDKIGHLQFDWKLSYADNKYSDFYLEGKYDIKVSSNVSGDYVSPKILQFRNESSVEINSPFNSLNIKYTLDGSEPNLNSSDYNNPIQISENTLVRFKFFNKKNQSAIIEPKQFEKLELLNSVNKGNLIEGLCYKYFEGTWDKLPNFSDLKSNKSGIAKDFLVGDISDSENNFAILYNGFIKIPETNLYIFRVLADDAAKLYLNSKLIIDQENSENYAAVYLEKGFHPIKIEYLEKQGNERFRLYSKENEKDDWKFMEFDNFYTNEN